VDPALLRRRLKPVGEGAELADDGEERRAPEAEAEATDAEADTAEDAPESVPAAPPAPPDPRRSTAYLSVMSRAEIAPDVDPDI
jgi:hypothetical protein